MAVVPINKVLKGLILPAMAVLGIALLSYSCEKEDLDPEYPFRITVKTLEDSTRAPNTFVEVHVPEDPNSNVFFEGFTDENGEISFSYDKNAILFIRASRGPKPNYTWMGCRNIRLKANEEATQTVYLIPYNERERGCRLQ